MRSPHLKRRLFLALSLMWLFAAGIIFLHYQDVKQQIRRSISLIQAQEIAFNFSHTQTADSLPSHYMEVPLSYSLYAPDGQLMWFAGELDRPLRFRMPEAQTWWQRLKTNWYQTQGSRITVPVTLSDGYILMVGKDDQLEQAQLDKVLQNQWWRSVLLLLPFVLLGAALLLFLLHWTFKPLQKSSRFLKKRSADKPEYRLPVAEFPVELHGFTHAINQALDQLATACTNERRFVANAAHELRTPLTVLDLRVQALQVALNNKQAIQENMTALQRELHALINLVDQLLWLARQDQHNPTQLSLQSLNLQHMVHETVASLWSMLEAQKRTVQLEIPRAVSVLGNAELLKAALRNVLENSLIHGTGTTTISQSSYEGYVCLDIYDEGEGIETHHIPHLFQRFYKVSAQSGGPNLSSSPSAQSAVSPNKIFRTSVLANSAYKEEAATRTASGSGLGLAITKAIMEAHQGSVTVLSAQPFRLQLCFKACDFTKTLPKQNQN